MPRITYSTPTKRRSQAFVVRVEPEVLNKFDQCMRVNFGKREAVLRTVVEQLPKLVDDLRKQANGTHAERQKANDQVALLRRLLGLSLTRVV